MYKLISILFLLINSANFSQSARANKALLHADGAGTSQAAFFQDNRMNAYDIKHLKLDIIVQPKSSFISANCSYKVQVQQSLDSFIMELRPTMNVDSVFVNNNKTVFSRRNDHIYIPINPVAAVGNQLNVSFYYKGNVAAGFHSGIDTKGFEYTASVSEAFQAREWFPAKQILNDKIDSTDIWITTSAPYKAGSNGLLKSVVALPGNLNQYRWSTHYPLNYYMPSVAVGNYLEYNIYAKPASIAPDSILVQNLVFNNAAYFANVKNQIDKTPRFIEKFSELFGLYPFYKEKYGHSQANIGGGMEHATMTTLQSFEEDLVAHELAHQWFGDNVTCGTWNDIWVNESFATYSQYLMKQYLPALFPNTAEQLMVDFHNNVFAEPGGSVVVPPAQTYDEIRIFNYRLTYAKGATALHNLRFEMQSDTLFFNTLKTYQQRFKNGFATTTDFKQVAEEVSRKNLTNFFNERIYGEGYPTYNVTFLKHGSDTLILNIVQTTSMPAVTPLFSGLVQFKILSALGDTTITINQTANNQTFAIYYKKTPRGVEVDPNNWIVNKAGTITEGVSTTPETPKQVKIIPNPVTTSAFTISMPPNQFSAVRLIDVNGRVLKKGTIAAGATTFIQDVPFASGVYFVHLTGEKENLVKKVLVVKN